MRAFRFVLLSSGIAFLLWAVVSWPLVRHIGEGIPASPINPERAPPLAMIAGDHLQLLLQLWLGHDTFFGPTPWSTNLYEFNIGNDAAGRGYSTYYFPFHFFYGVGHALGGHALGWNVAAILSLAISLGATVLWLRRWVPDRPLLLWSAAIAGQLLPYRWHTLLNGSPTGLSLMWIPVILLGMDLWLRDGRARGAALAGAGVFFSGWSDTHVFFFGALLGIAWALPNLFAARERFRLTLTEWLGVLKSSWPLFVWAALVLFQAVKVKMSLKGTNNQAGRQIKEVALFSPQWRETLASEGFGGFRETYLGWGLLALALAALLACGVRAWRGGSRERARFGLLAAILAGLALMTMFATGPNNPWGPRGWKALTTLLPPLGKLRQPAKIYLAFAPFVSLVVAMGWAALPLRFARILAPALLLPLGWSLTSAIHPRISLLDPPNAAYAAVAASSEKPRALALPLWPGDSHWSSLYGYYSMDPRLRMVNGYRPSRRLWYVDGVFAPLSPMNEGDFSDARLDQVLSYGVEHLFLHENAFPEKVSPFSVGYTLARMLAHPRLQRVAQDGPVWAFRILPPGAKDGAEAFPRAWDSFGAVRSWNLEFADGHFEILDEAGAYKGKAIRLRGTGDHATAIRFPVSLSGEQQILLRHRGRGAFEAELIWGELRLAFPIAGDSSDWQWTSLPLPLRSGRHDLILNLRGVDGQADVDIAQLAPAGWDPAATGVRSISAATLFHAGHTDLEKDAVVFQPERDPHAAILYGPGLPLVAGEYAMKLEVDSEAPAGTVLGMLRLRGPEAAEVPVVAGKEHQLQWRHGDRDFFAFEFVYHGTHPLRVRRAVLVPRWPLPLPGDPP